MGTMYLLPELKFKLYHGQLVGLIERKYDGYYFEFYRDNNDFGIWTNFKDQNTNIWNKLKRIQSINRMLISLPDHTCFRAELFAKNIPATSVISLLNNADERLELRVFELPIYEHIDFTKANFTEVKNILQDKHGINTVEVSYRYEHGKVLTEKFIEELKLQAKKLGWEGYVARTSHTGDAFKIKPLKTVDAFVIGYTISESMTFYGALKAFQVAVYKNNQVIQIASISTGLLHEFKLNCHPENYINKVMEIEYDNVAAKGKLRFPRFKRWRDDKKKEQCFIEQLNV